MKVRLYGYTYMHTYLHIYLRRIRSLVFDIVCACECVAKVSALQNWPDRANQTLRLTSVSQQECTYSYMYVYICIVKYKSLAI